jgi:hypothetical protein
MKLRGNYPVLYGIELITGILTFTLCWFYGDLGLYALALFFVGMALTMKTKVDEREMQLMYKASAFEPAVIGAAMAIIYFSLPMVNWFHSFISIAMVTRGISGLILFAKE